MGVNRQFPAKTAKYKNYNISEGSTSEMQRTVDELVKWSQLNCLNINRNKTKEMVLG